MRDLDIIGKCEKNSWAAFKMQYKYEPRDYYNLKFATNLNVGENIKTLIGVTQDKETDRAVFTFSHNIIIYNFKSTEPYYVEEKEWQCRCRLTRAVVFDSFSDCYLAVFNHDTIRQWTRSTDCVDDVPKHKFKLPIQNIVTRENKPPLVVFENGKCVSLPYAIENLATLKSGESLIKDSSIVDTGTYVKEKIEYICHIIKHKNGKHLSIVTCPLKDESNECDSSRARTIKVVRSDDVKDTYITGKVLVDGKTPVAYFVWNDKHFEKYDIIKNISKSLAKKKPALPNCDSPVALQHIGKSFLAFYGEEKPIYNHKMKSWLLVRNANDWNYANFQFIEYYDKEARLINCGIFLLLIDRKTVRLFILEPNCWK